MTVDATQLAEAYQATFAPAAGQMVLRDLLGAGGVLAVSHVQGDPYDTAFNDGKRALALHLLQRLRWSESELLQLGERLTADELAERSAVMEASEF